jgi:predicted GIY-YIG superfamily endonuclease
MVMWDKDGLMYGGSTAGLKTRLGEHMKDTRGAEFKALRMLYAVLPSLGEAKQLEQQLVRRMEDAGLPMWSTFDAKKRSNA